MKIAIIKLSSLGDIIHTTFVLEFIKNSYPNYRVDWFVESSFSEILEHNPYIDKVYRLNLKSIKSSIFNIYNQIELIRNISKKERYDLVIDFQGLIKSAIVARLLSKNIVGFSKTSIKESIASIFYSKTLDIDYCENTIVRYAKLCEYALDIKIDISKKSQSMFFEKSHLNRVSKYINSSKKNIIFIVGSTWESRNYPIEKFIELASKIDANILIPYGSKRELEDALAISKSSNNVTVLDKLTLNELKAVISSVDLLIGGDTGPTYIAWANGVKTIILFGPTPKSRVYENDSCIAIESESIVNHYKLNRYDFSIKDIDVSQILEIKRGLLNER